MAKFNSLILVCLLPFFSFSQEIRERIPDSSYTVGWTPHYKQLIVSYVHLPNDSNEYKKVKIYLKYTPNRYERITQQKSKDLSRLRYLGTFLKPTGKKSTPPIEPVENPNLRTIDVLLNNENFGENSQ